MASQNLLESESTAVSECLDRLARGHERSRPLATYRLQFHSAFQFEDGRKLASYLHDLGISHCYSSPILRSRAGSTHGYDITNHNQIDPELGGEAGFRALVHDLRRAGLGLILDIVPNHMGVGHGGNPWWQDVVQNGESSEYANYFDIDWTPLKGELHGKVLLPILGGQYGDELERGNIALIYEDGQFVCRYFDNRVALDPRSYPVIFESIEDLRGPMLEAEWKSSGMAELEVLLSELRALPHHNSSEGEDLLLRRRTIPGLKRRLAELARSSEAVRECIEKAVQRSNGVPGDHRSFDLLHRLLEAQAFRLAHWRVSSEEINYRRFFDINDLVGLRMENPEVFAATHRLIRRLLAENMVDGIRLDHPDGLYNPMQYFMRLQMLYAAAHCCGPSPGGRTAENGIEEEVVGRYSRREWQQPALYTLVEKILEVGEDLPQHWPVTGTVGYEFGNLVNGIFIDQSNVRPFTIAYHRFIGGPMDIATVIYASKKLVLSESLASEALVLMHLLDEIASNDRHARDFTRSALLQAIRETVACFPVYRTYIDGRGQISDNDRRYIEMAVARAKRRNESMSTKVFDLLRNILLLRPPQHSTSASDYRKRLRFVLKFQQLTGPVMAKGLEDTACYVYNRLLSENEVGSSPEEFGLSIADFHAGNSERARRWPDSMLSTSTHDSKRSEDVRARLNVLTEIPRPWSATALRWRRTNKAKKKMLGDGRMVPDRNEEYLLYQTLVGTWPLEIALDNGARGEFIGRIQQYMAKAVHEAKVNLSWTNQNPEYVEALEEFIARILKPGSESRPNLFLQSMEQFLPAIQYFGCINAVAQVLLKLTCPGMPDIYQGQELWEFSLVDPDNRRPVDFDLRRKLLAEVERDRGSSTFCEDLVRNFADGRLKLWTTTVALRFRRQHPALYQEGGYRMLYAAGKQSKHVVAFAREHQGEAAITVAPLLSYTLCGGKPETRLGDCWGETRVILPPYAASEWDNVLTGERLQAEDGSLACAAVFGRFPVALLKAVAGC